MLLTMHIKKLQEKVAVPSGVDIKIEKQTLTIKGKKGELKKDFIYPTINIAKEGDFMIFSATNATKRDKTMIGTFAAHLKSMIVGTSEGHTYMLKICSGHFPMRVALKGKEFVVENFLGEKIPRKLTIHEGATVKIEGNDVTVSAIDKEIAGGCAAAIEKLTRVTGRDRRIFQDGIYITMKSGKPVAE